MAPKWTYIGFYLTGALAEEGGCSIDQGVIDPRPFHRGFVFRDCTNGANADNVVPNGTKCGQVFCQQFKFSSVSNATCVDGQWSQLPSCFKGCEAPTSLAGYQFMGCRRNLGSGTSRNKGWYNDADGVAFYPPLQRCRKVVCPSMNDDRYKEIPREIRANLKEKLIGNRFECTCNIEGDCFWLHFNDQAYGDSLNEDITLSCAQWSEWNTDGACTRKKRQITRACLQPNGDEGTAGIDCEGEATRTVPCGRRHGNQG